MTVNIRPWGIAFFALTLLHLTILFFGWDTMHLIVKPMFMPMLIVMLAKTVTDRKSAFYRLMQFGLLLSWLGDIALMLDRDNPNLFIAGLSFFLIAHIGYSLAFYKSIQASGKPLDTTRAGAVAAVFLSFTGVFFFLMKDGLGEMFAPVLAYTLVITAMGIIAALRIGHVPKHDGIIITIGAILFILSDCVIAWNKFVVDFPHDQVLNMSLYLSGQFMLAYGTVLHVNGRGAS